MLTSFPPSPEGHTDRREKPGDGGEVRNGTAAFHSYIQESYVFSLQRMLTDCFFCSAPFNHATACGIRLLLYRGAEL